MYLFGLDSSRYLPTPKTMFLDISDLIRKPKSGQGDQHPNADSKAAVVSKDEALTLASPDQIEGKLNKLEHSEDIPAWTASITEFLTWQADFVTFADLQRRIPLDLAQLWLGLLHGNFRLQQSTLYEPDTLWVAIALH